MSSILRNWIIFLLLIFSAISIFAHQIGIFKVEHDLLAESNHTAIYGSTSANLEHTLTIAPNEITLKCTVLYDVQDNYCALTIVLSKTGNFPEIAKGLDLSEFEYIDMDIDYSAPQGSPNVRVSVRNYNPSYAIDGKFESLKYNSISFEPQYNNSFVTRPLSSFSVEQWWIDRFDIPKPLQSIEFDNVPFIEILPNEISRISDYEITINRFVLVGEYFSETTLFSAILCLWSVLIVGLVAQNTRHLKYIATTDLLTGCYNRRGLTHWANKKLSFFYAMDSISVFYFDLDNFKDVNDEFGHKIGDQLLCQFSKRILNTVKAYGNTDVKYRVARLAGDEFAIILFNVSEKHLEQIAATLMEVVTRPINLKSCTIKTSVSLGISFARNQPDSLQQLIDKADMAMYFAKKHGKNQFKIFDQSIAKDVYFRKKTSEKLKIALENSRFHLHFMPIYQCKSLKVERVEVLLRCHDPALSGIGPDVYIPVAEEFNQIQAIDMWVIENTFRTIHENMALFVERPVTFCINISAAELHNNNFVQALSHLLTQYKIPARYIELEITETSLIDANHKSIRTLEEIRALDIELALDDFGTGYTAFNQLIHYPVNCLKIDKSFIDNLSEQNETQITMLNAILSIAKAFKLKTVAEGIETKQQLDLIQKYGCDMAQGYLLCKSIEFSQFIEVLHNSK